MTREKRRPGAGDPRAVTTSNTTSDRPLTDDSPLVQALLPVARVFARLVVAELRAGATPEHYDQHDSPLGSRRHCALIRRGVIPGTKIGRRYLAKRSDVDAYMAGPAVARTVPSPAPEGDGDAELARELGLRVVR